MSEPTHILTHAADSVAMLLSTLQDEDANTAELVERLGDIAQTLEDDIWECLVERYISTAVGVQLDAWGRVLGRARRGLADADYRRLLSVWQQAMLSQGRRNPLLRAVIAVMEPEATRYLDLTDGWYTIDLYFLDPPGPWSATLVGVLEDILEAASPSGVQWRIIEAEADVSFRHDMNARGHDSGEMGRRML